MSSSINYDKQVYKKSEMGLLQSFIGRFHNIKAMSTAFTGTPQFFEVKKLRDEAEEFYNKKTDEMSVVEKELRERINIFNAEIEAYQLSAMNKEANILREFEKNYKEKHDN